MKRLAACALLIVSILWPGRSFAEPGATSLEFLRIGQGARGVAMGGAFTAVVNDATSMYWNPAGLGAVRSAQVTFQTNQYIADIDQNYLALAFPTLFGNFGMSANVLSIDDIERTTLTSGQAGQVLGFYGARDMAMDVGWGMEVLNGVSVGLAGRFITSRIYDQSGTAFAGDVGIQLRPLEFWTIGAAVKNFGTGIKYLKFEEPLPRSLRLGTALNLLPNRNLTLSLDLNKVKYDDFFINFGTEYTLLKHISFRLGYTLENKDVDEGMTAGLGVRFKILDLDYAFVPFGIFGDTHRFSLTVRFGGMQKIE